MVHSVAQEGSAVPTETEAASGSVCRNCAGEEWVCENHEDRPWNDRVAFGCECGAGAPCPVCNKEMACAGLVFVATDPLKKTIADLSLAAGEMFAVLYEMFCEGPVDVAFAGNPTAIADLESRVCAVIAKASTASTVGMEPMQSAECTKQSGEPNV